MIDMINTTERWKHRADDFWP